MLMEVVVLRWANTPDEGKSKVRLVGLVAGRPTDRPTDRYNR